MASTSRRPYPSCDPPTPGRFEDRRADTEAGLPDVTAPRPGLVEGAETGETGAVDADD